MPRPLEGQRALVTGSSSGIGRAVALAFGRAGAAVAVNFESSEDKANAVVRELEAIGARAFAQRADVSKPSDCEALFRAVVDRFGGLDIAVLNAGIQRDAPFAEMSFEQWQRVIDVNLTGPFLCAQQAVRQFRHQPRPAGASRAVGKILFINSVHQTIPWAGHANYAAAKGGLKLLMQTLAQEVAGEGIRVNAIAPGAIKTAINQSAWQDGADQLLALIPYGRIGEPHDVGRAAVWLASDEADYVVGATLFVDGAMTLYPAFRENG
jgi:glucose 1-dehydrogenase